MLLSRASVVPVQLAEPGPSEGGSWPTILDAGLRSPDHGRLRPWRFAVVRGAARAALGELPAGPCGTD
jgi:Nitroreductase family